MPDELRRLQNDHLNFRKLLRLFESQIALFHGGAEPDYELMRDVMHYMTQYPDRYHHPAEDLIFERLLKRAPAAQPLVKALEKEHEELVAGGVEMLQMLDEVVSDAIIPRESVESSARTYVQQLVAHMDKEESTLFPMAAQQLTAEDWTAIGAAVKRREDPLFSARVDQKYRAILEHLSPPG